MYIRIVLVKILYLPLHVCDSDCNCDWDIAIMRVLHAFTAIACAAQAAALSINIGGETMVVERDAGLQDVVSFDTYWHPFLKNWIKYWSIELPMRIIKANSIGHI